MSRCFEPVWLYCLVAWTASEMTASGLEMLLRAESTALSEAVVDEAVAALVRIYGKPACIVSDNGTEFTSKAILKWANENGVLFLETSSMTGENVEAPFALAARSILLAIESGKLDPEKAGSGISYGDRALRRVGSGSR